MTTVWLISTKKTKLQLKHSAVSRKLKAYTSGGKVNRLRVDMGKAILDPKEIPVVLDGDKVVDRPVEIAGKNYNITCVSMGNPHCVVFMDDIDNLDIETVGPEFENDKLFPERVNTEFVTVLDDHTIKMRVWERGSGETWLAVQALVPLRLPLVKTVSAKRAKTSRLSSRAAILLSTILMKRYI